MMAMAMNNRDLYQEILEDTAKLVSELGAKRRGSIPVSPETAARWNQLQVASAGSGETSAALEALGEEVSTCTKCALCEGRTQTVFGSGNPNADLVFVGEAPGFEEDRQGLPFVGRAGKLLTDIIEKGMQLKRKDVYICNVLKCRPPENRDPRPDEVDQCEPYLIEQLRLIKPKVICALGSHAARTLLKTEASVGKLRGEWHSYHGIPLRVTYHPAYLLRNPADKRKTWTDVLEVLKVYQDEEQPQMEPSQERFV